MTTEKNVDLRKALGKRMRGSTARRKSRQKRILRLGILGGPQKNRRACRQLSVKDRNVFQQIYDYIVRAIKNATGDAELRQLNAIKENFDKAYRELRETPSSAGVKFSQGSKWVRDIDKLETPGTSNGDLLEKTIASVGGNKNLAIKKLNTSRYYRQNDYERISMLRQMGDDITGVEFDDAMNNSLFVGDDLYARISASLRERYGASTGIKRITVVNNDGAYTCLYNGEDFAIVHLEGGAGYVRKSKRNNIAKGERRSDAEGITGSNDGSVGLRGKATADGTDNRVRGNNSRNEYVDVGFERKRRDSLEESNRWENTEPPKGGSFNGDVKYSRSKNPPTAKRKDVSRFAEARPEITSRSPPISATMEPSEDRAGRKETKP